jgi:hypothetical protein
MQLLMFHFADVFQPTQKPGLVDSFVCNCADCHKFTASAFASNFIVDDKYLKHARGQENLTKFAQSKTIESSNVMTNCFCSTCGTLMYRISTGFPGMIIARIGTVDDFNLHNTKLKPRIEQYTKDRVGFFTGCVGAEEHEGGYFK